MEMHSRLPILVTVLVLLYGATGGIDQIRYTWHLNGVVLMADPGHISITSSFSITTLMITNVTATDDGNYICEATDEFLDATSNESILFGNSVVSNFKVYFKYVSPIK